MDGQWGTRAIPICFSWSKQQGQCEAASTSFIKLEIVAFYRFISHTQQFHLLNDERKLKRQMYYNLSVVRHWCVEFTGKRSGSVMLYRV